MAKYTYEDVIPSLIENTTMFIRYIDGIASTYNISPIEGYVLHDKNRDWESVDMDTNEETYLLGYTTGTATCPKTYDFGANTREFFAVPAETVPENQIFGQVKNRQAV